MTGVQHPLVQDYLARLDRAAVGLPAQIRAELETDLSAHIDSALGADSTDADVRNVLQELGTPEAVVAAAYDGLDGAPPVLPMAPVGQVPVGQQPAPAPGPSVWPMPPPSPWGPVEIVAVIGLTAGTFLVPFVGPLVGLVMAWVSDKWSRKEKVIATGLCLAPVLVLSIALIGLVATSSSSGSGSGSNPVPVVSTQTDGGTP